jgi:hypothetical protein
MPCVYFPGPAPAVTVANSKAVPSLLSVRSLNCFKLPDLASLPALLHENQPGFIFLQEVGPTAQLSRLASAASPQLLGTQVSLQLALPCRTMVVLSREPDVHLRKWRPATSSSSSGESSLCLSVPPLWPG